MIFQFVVLAEHMDVVIIQNNKNVVLDLILGVGLTALEQVQLNHLTLLLIKLAVMACNPRLHQLHIAIFIVLQIRHVKHVRNKTVRVLHVIVVLIISVHGLKRIYSKEIL
jgi:hypothetical protein